MAAGIPDYARTPRADVPEACKWRIADLFEGPGAWRAELEAVRVLAADLDALAKGWTASAQALATFMERLDAVHQRAQRLHSYASLNGDMDLGDPAWQGLKGEARALLVDLNARLAFMDPDLLALGQARLEAYLQAEPRLAPYRVGFLRTLRLRDHVLAEGEERIVATAGLFTPAPAAAAGMLNNVDLPRPEVTLADGTRAVLDTAAFNRLRASGVAADRRLVMEARFRDQARFGNTFATLLDAGVKQDWFKAKVRRYPSSLEAALHPQAIDPAVYRTLVETVKANLGPLHRLLRLRRRMLGLDRLRYADLYAPAVAAAEGTTSFEAARDLVLAATAPLGPEYRDGLERAFDGGWIDVYPNLGKQSGAYSSGVHGVHPFVKMNYDGSLREVSTLAHELGHALHSWLADRAQPFATARYPIFLAEIASTFNENLLMRHLLDTVQDATLKLHLLDRHLETLRATLFRQTLFADFELAMHARVEQGQSLTPDWLDREYLALARCYHGHDAGVTEVEDWVGAEWSSIPHFFYNFYVYQYATGIVSSMALGEALFRDPGARDRYLAFLRAGGSAFPLDSLRAAGVDLASPAPVEAALEAFDGLVARMEDLHARLQEAPRPGGRP